MVKDIKHVDKITKFFRDNNISGIIFTQKEGVFEFIQSKYARLAITEFVEIFLEIQNTLKKNAIKHELDYHDKYKSHKNINHINYIN